MLGLEGLDGIAGAELVAHVAFTSTEDGGVDGDADSPATERFGALQELFCDLPVRVDVQLEHERR